METNKQIEITAGRVHVDGVDVGAVLAARPEAPALFACYSVSVDVTDMLGQLTGATATQYYLYNGVGYAQITGAGEQVTIHE